MGIKHGMSHTPLYKVWSEMVRRATNPSHPNAKHYVAKGVGVSEDWRQFEKFYADMGDRPDGTWLERLDNSAGYSKSNCVWATPSAQCSNRDSGKNKSGRMGVYFDKSVGRWRALIKINKKRVDCGRHDSYESACDAVNAAELLHLGYSREGVLNGT